MEILHHLDQIQSDFDRIRWDCDAVEAQLFHKATNAEHEGVIGIPQQLFRQLVAHQGAGHREFYQNFDSKGNPRFRSDPILDVEGNPIQNSVGEAFDVVMPAFRSVSFAGSHRAFEKLDFVAERAGRLLAKAPEVFTLCDLRRWRFSRPSELWWAVLFEIAWAGWHPFLKAERRIWLPAEKPSVYLPYDVEQLRGFASDGFGPGPKIPKSWLQRLPEAYVSELENVAVASFDATDYLIARLAPNGSTAAPSRDAETVMQDADRPLEQPIKRRFAVALSFPGEHRTIVCDIANALAKVFTENRVLYDAFHEAELSRPDLDLYLQNLYKDQSDLVVVFVCGEYEKKKWCGIEWRAIRDLMQDVSRGDESIMFLRLDDKELPGLFGLDGYSKISGRPAQSISDLILKRWCATR